MDADDQQRVICVMGPTGAGKTELAVAALEQLGCQLISVDSALVYRRMDIGTAKPDSALLARAPHRLINIREPWQSYSAGDFVVDANAALDELAARSLPPLLVGGTFLYFRALIRGLSELPDAAPRVRARLDAQAAEAGWPALHARLARVDPAAAARIGPNDSQRIQRALEVHELTGVALSQLQTGGRGRPGRYLNLIVAPAERALLHQRIEQRFDAMLEAGFLDEVRALMDDQRLSVELPAMRAVGYRQAWQHLSGTLDFQQMRNQALAATRQLAKRQLTWLRNQCQGQWIDPTRPHWKSAAMGKIAQFLHIPL